MIKKCLFPLLASIILCQGIGAQEATDKAKINALDSKIMEVTVYADRARVTREVTLELPAQTDRFSFAKLPSWIDEGSVRVSLKAAAGAHHMFLQPREEQQCMPSSPVGGRRMRRPKALPFIASQAPVRQHLQLAVAPPEPLEVD